MAAVRTTCQKHAEKGDIRISRMCPIIWLLLKFEASKHSVWPASICFDWPKAIAEVKWFIFHGFIGPCASNTISTLRGCNSDMCCQACQFPVKYVACSNV